MTALSPTAMVLAAGLGTRMRPLTLAKPKPLFDIGGRAMLDLALDRLIEIGIERAIVNTFHLADQIATHLASRRDIDIVISRETELLDTGGGIKNVLDAFDGKPFFALNADLPWIDTETPSLARMKNDWNPDCMDALLLTMPTVRARGFSPDGNLFINERGQITRQGTQPPRPFVMISAQIVVPAAYHAIPERIFSNTQVWDAAEAQGRLYGTVHQGTCYHVGTPEDWRTANDLLASGQGWGVGV